MSNNNDRVLFFPEEKLCFSVIRRKIGLLSEDCMNRNCSFRHGNTNVNIIVDLLWQAERTIDICMDVLTYQPIAELFIQQHKRGLKVRAITCSKKDDPHDRMRQLQEAGIPVKRNKDYYMHNKFVIIDNVKVIQGSANWSVAAFNHNDEYIKIEDEPPIVDKFIKQYEKLWNDFEETRIPIMTRRRRYNSF